MPYAENTVSAFSILSVLHEIYSYNKFQREPVLNLIIEMRKALIQGGRVIVREPAKPDNPDEFLHIILNGTEGNNPQDIESLLQTPPSQLSQAALFKRFLLQFKPLQNSTLIEKTTKIDENQYIMPAWLISEFFRKRKNTVTPEFFESEMEEQTNVFTIEGLRQLAQEAGFRDDKIQIISIFEEDFYGKVEPEEITIKNSNGILIKQDERFPSHLHGTFIK